MVNPPHGALLPSVPGAERTVDLTRGPLIPLHGLGGPDIPLAALPVRAHARHAGVGWAADLGWLGEDEWFLALTSPGGEQVAFSVTEPHADDPVLVADAFRPPVGELFGPGVPGEVVWQRVARMFEIGQRLASTAVPRSPEARSPWLTHFSQLSWAYFATEEEADRWRLFPEMSGAAAGEYAAAGHTPEWSASWIAYVVPVAKAEFLDAHGWTPGMAAALDDMRFAQEGSAQVSEEIWRSWVASGIPPRLAVIGWAAGLTPEEMLAQAPDEATLAALVALRGFRVEDLFVHAQEYEGNPATQRLLDATYRLR